MTTENTLTITDLKLHDRSLIEVRDEKIKADRGQLLYLDPMKRGDIATLNLSGQSILFVCGIPRARFDYETEVLTLSRQIRTLPDSEWILEQIYAAFPSWRSRVERNQPALDNCIEIK